jgi:hypothetical protein
MLKLVNIILIIVITVLVFFPYLCILSAIECESGNAEVQWNNIKECMLDAVSDLVGKVEKRARKP